MSTTPVPPSVVLLIGESRLITMDFASLLARGETVTSVISVTVDQITAPPVTIGTPSFSGSYAQARFSGGQSDTRYLTTFIVGTSGGNTLKGEGYLQCRGPNNFLIAPGTAQLGIN